MPRKSRIWAFIFGDFGGEECKENPRLVPLRTVVLSPQAALVFNVSWRRGLLSAHTARVYALVLVANRRKLRQPAQPQRGALGISCVLEEFSAWNIIEKYSAY
ncbi:hypothetical protein U1Q18_005987 [Sarracenia purpurea var. burkii]